MVTLAFSLAPGVDFSKKKIYPCSQLRPADPDHLERFGDIWSGRLEPLKSRKQPIPYYLPKPLVAALFRKSAVDLALMTGLQALFALKRTYMTGVILHDPFTAPSTTYYYL